MLPLFLRRSDEAFRAYQEEYGRLAGRDAMNLVCETTGTG